MRRTIIFILFIPIFSIFVSCKDEGQRMADDFIEALNNKDTAKINDALLPRHAIWKDVIFADFSKNDVKIEEVSGNRYKASIDDSTYFILAKNDKGYKIEEVKNVFIVPANLLHNVNKSDYIKNGCDDIEILAAVNKVRCEMEKQEAQLALDEETEKKIRALYDNYIFGGREFDADADKFCTPKMLKKLAAAYDYEGGGYAVWELRTGAQDGDGGSQVNDVTPLGDGWYEVDFLDMGMHGKKKIKAVKQNGKILFDDYK